MICSKCKEDKLQSDFAKKSGRRNYQSYCKKCSNRYITERWIRRKQDAIKYKGGKCCRCGYNKFYGALEFHHRDPNQKEKGWPKLRNLSWDKVLAEIDKCDLLCANCHREVHNEAIVGESSR